MYKYVHISTHIVFHEYRTKIAKFNVMHKLGSSMVVPDGLQGFQYSWRSRRLSLETILCKLRKAEAKQNYKLVIVQQIRGICIFFYDSYFLSQVYPICNYYTLCDLFLVNHMIYLMICPIINLTEMGCRCWATFPWGKRLWDGYYVCILHPISL